MNKVIISGNLTRDMDVKVLANETIVGNFTVAVLLNASKSAWE